MSLKKIIAQDFKEAFKSKDLKTKSVLSMLQSEIKNKEIELGKKENGLNDEEIISLVLKAIKQRKDSANQYEKGGREDLAAGEREEAELLKKYLPVQLSEEEVEKEARKIIEETGAANASDIGKVMGAAMKKLKGQAEGEMIRSVANKLLSGQK